MISKGTAALVLSLFRPNAHRAMPAPTLFQNKAANLTRCSAVASSCFQSVPLAACPSSHGSWLTGEIIAKDHRDSPHSFHEAPGASGISHNQSRSRGGGKSRPADLPPSLFASCQTALAGFPRSRFREPTVAVELTDCYLGAAPMPGEHCTFCPARPFPRFRDRTIAPYAAF